MIDTLIIINVVLQLADVWTTVRGMSSGRTHEANPLLVWLAGKLPGRWTWLIVSKSALFALLAWVWTLPENIWINGALVATMLIYVYVVFTNWKLVK